jgi:hypothetical protein
MPQTAYDQNASINPLRPIGPSDPIPWKDRSVTLFWFDQGALQQTHSLSGKREAVATAEGPLMAAWTGQWRTDLVSVDRAALVEALG